MYSYSFQKEIKDLQQLERRIREDFPGILYSVFCENNVQIFFEYELTEIQQLQLQQIVNSFIEYTRKENLCQTVLYLPTTVSNDSWTLLSSWIYPGISNLQTLQCNVHSHLIDGIPGDSYDIRVYDSYNNVVLAQTTFTNTSCVENVLPIDAQLLPYALSLFELHCKVSNTNSTCMVQSACVASI